MDSSVSFFESLPECPSRKVEPFVGAAPKGGKWFLGIQDSLVPFNESSNI